MNHPGANSTALARTFDGCNFDSNIIISDRVNALLKDVVIRDAVAQIRKGGNLLKWVSNQFKKPHFRYFYFEAETLALRWNSPKKTPQQSTVFLMDVILIVPGWDSDFSKFKNNNYAIEIQSSSTLRIGCNDEQEWKMWMAGLLHFYQKATNRKKLGRNLAYELTLKRAGANIHTDPRNIQLVEVLLRSWNISIEQRHVESLFNKYDIDNSGVLEVDEFNQLLNEILILRDAHDIFVKYADKSAHLMAQEGYERFLRELQKEVDGVSHSKYIKQMQSLEEPFLIKNKLTEIGFSLLLMSDMNDLMHPYYRTVHQPMDYPLSSYWVATSHNTYLTGDQLIGKSAVGQYIDVLLRGCRCVELDVWDGPNGEPILFHGLGGYPLSGKIPFAGVIQACKDYGFVKSPYPIILSLEVRCTDKTKERVAQILEAILGDLIYICDSDTDALSPEALRGKFLIKAKIPYEMEESLEDHVDEEALEMYNHFSEEVEDVAVDAALQLRMSQSLRSNTNTIKAGVSERLRQYIKFISLPSKRFRDFYENTSDYRVLTFSETHYAKCARKNYKDVEALTHRHLVKVFPSGTRLGSSNFNPMPLWIHGVQLVALNYQSFGVSTILAEGRFSLNGGRNCGYVLKESIRNRSSNSTGVGPRHTSYRITLQVLSARNLPTGLMDSNWYSLTSQVRNGNGTSKPNGKDTLSLYITVGILGDRQTRKRYRTTTVVNNGFNPRWNRENALFEFDVQFPTADILVFTVRKNDSVRSFNVAAAAMPIETIRPGIRWVPLFDTKFRYVETRGLLIQCSMEPYSD